MLQSMDNVPEIKYILDIFLRLQDLLIQKNLNLTKINNLFEGILYSALTLYNNGGASRSKLAESHRRFVQEIEQKMKKKIKSYATT